MIPKSQLDNNWTLGPSVSQRLRCQYADHDGRVIVVPGSRHKMVGNRQVHKYSRKDHGLSRSLPSVFTSYTDQAIQLDGGRAIIFLRRHDDGHLGVGIQGGQEFNSPVTVSIPGEQGLSRGLREGDIILNVNGVDFTNMTHAEAVTVIQSAWNVLMLVQHQDTPKRNPELNNSGQTTFQEHKLFMYPRKSKKLGFGVKRHHNGNLQIVQISDDSPASQAGLRYGDCLYEIEGIRVSTLSDQQIFALTQDTKRIYIKIYRQIYKLKDEYITEAQLSMEVTKQLHQLWSSTPRNTKKARQ